MQWQAVIVKAEMGEQAMIIKQSITVRQQKAAHACGHVKCIIMFNRTIGIQPVDQTLGRPMIMHMH